METFAPDTTYRHMKIQIATERRFEFIDVTPDVEALIARAGIHPRIGAVDPQFGKIPHRSFDRRPQLFLIGGQLEAGMNGCDARVRESRPVLWVHPHLAMTPVTMLGIDGGRTGDGEYRDRGDGEVSHADLL